jgi:MoaA/NifB/PqqE/SkfB family radical SAM enzyme
MSSRNISLRVQPRAGQTSASLEQILKIISEANHDGASSVIFDGPEPTRHTYLRQMVEYSKALGMKVVIYTHGGSRHRHYRRLTQAGADEIIFAE